MKKIVSLLFMFQLIVISVCGLDVFKNYEINSLVHKDTDSITRGFDLIRSSNIQIDSGVIGTIALVTLCFLIAVVHYCVIELKKVSIVRINDLTLTKIWGNINKALLIIMFIGATMAYIICSIYCIYIDGFNYLGILSFYFVILAIFFTLISSFILFLVILMHRKKSNLLILIKSERVYGILGFMHCILKIIFMLFILFFINKLSINSSGLNQKLDIVILLISNLIITYSVIASYYEKNKKILYIKKLFGYDVFRKNRIFIISLCVINILPIVCMASFYGNKIISVGIILILVEFVVATIMDRILDVKAFNSIVEGEKQSWFRLKIFQNILRIRRY